MPKLTNPVTDAKLLLDGCDILSAIRTATFGGTSLMPSSAIATVVKMMQSLPDATQNKIVEHLREYLEYICDEKLWDEAFEKTQDKLVATATRVRQEIGSGHTKALDYNQL